MKGGGTDPNSERHYEALIEVATGAFAAATERILERPAVMLLPLDWVAPQVPLVPQWLKLWDAQHVGSRL